MKPLFILLLAFGVSLLIARWQGRKNAVMASGRVAMSVMLCFTAIGHFAFTEGMSMMLPDFVPYKRGIVLFTGVLEILGAIGLLIPQYRRWVAWLLLAFFILVLPANIYAALHHVDYQQASYQGQGTEYLLFRIPLQI